MSTWTNKQGNTVTSRFVNHDGEADRYRYDFTLCRSSDGWKQYDTDQDAPYFGVWYHTERRETVTYAEGDEIRVKCPTAESFRAELDDMARCYGAPPPAFITYGEDEDGRLVRTEHYDADARP